MSVELKMNHAREFTDIEDSVLDVWLALENAGLDEHARRVLDSGLIWEHFSSLLDNDPNKRTQEEVVQAASLATKFNGEVSAGLQAMREAASNRANQPALTHDMMIRD